VKGNRIEGEMKSSETGKPVKWTAVRAVER
jgi:hypothetical protein